MPKSPNLAEAKKTLTPPSPQLHPSTPTQPPPTQDHDARVAHTNHHQLKQNDPPTPAPALNPLMTHPGS